LLRLYLAVILALTNASGIAFADPIEGYWKTMDDTFANIYACADRFCILMKTGEYEGIEIGNLKPMGNGKYNGKITAPDDGKSYEGRAQLSGNELRLSGCSLKIFCRTEIWTRMH
jgi:uncharacterized protein (DUF2147 family)